MEDRDHHLREDLIRWRKNQQVKKGFGGDVFFGPHRILSDQVLDYIVDLAHYSKITSIQVLGKQTLWKGTTKYGNDILALIRAHAPPNMTNPTPRGTLLPINSPSSSSHHVQFVFESGITEPAKRLPTMASAGHEAITPLGMSHTLFLRGFLLRCFILIKLSTKILHH